MNWILSHTLLPYLLGPLVFVVMQLLKKAPLAIDKLPSWAKQGVVFVISQVLVFLQAWSGNALACGANCGLADVGEPFVKGVLVAGSAFLMHYLKKMPAA